MKISFSNCVGPHADEGFAIVREVVQYLQKIGFEVHVEGNLPPDAAHNLIVQRLSKAEVVVVDMTKAKDDHVKT